MGSATNIDGQLMLEDGATEDGLSVRLDILVVVPSDFSERLDIPGVPRSAG